MALNNGLEIIDETVSVLDCKQMNKQTPQLWLIEVESADTQPRPEMKGNSAAEDPGVMTQEIHLECYP